MRYWNGYQWVDDPKMAKADPPKEITEAMIEQPPPNLVELHPPPVVDVVYPPEDESAGIPEPCLACAGSTTSPHTCEVEVIDE